MERNNGWLLGWSTGMGSVMTRGPTNPKQTLAVSDFKKNYFIQIVSYKKTNKLFHTVKQIFK